MHRRQLLKAIGIIPVTYPLYKTYNSIFSDNLLNSLIVLNDSTISELRGRQEKRKDSQNYGGLSDAFGIYNVHSTGSFIVALACGYASEASEYYRKSDLEEPLELAMDYIVSHQYQDGTVDLYTTNFHSTPDTAFLVEPMTAVYGIFEREKYKPGRFMEKLQTFLSRAGEALLKGGIHTPNHRWVVCMALSRLNSLFPDKRYIIRIDKWLSEKIDIDPDGQYAERSAMIYTPLVNRCLITMARLTRKTELLEHVRKNLTMSVYYMHTNGEIVTESSRRQDQYQKGNFNAYYYPYRYMAIMDKNRLFSAMTASMEASYPGQLQFWLPYLIEDPFMQHALPEPANLPQDYIKEFTHSGLVRIRHGKSDATIISGNPSFFTFFKGNAVLQGVRLASAFFGKGQFTGEKIEKDGAYYVLRTSMQGPYYQPYPEELLPGDGNWEKMPRQNRPQSEVQNIEYEARIREKDDGFELAFRITGTDNVPVALELAFRKGGSFTGVNQVNHTEDTYLLEKGSGEYHFGDDVISFGPGLADHSWTVLRGALPRGDSMSVYLTGFTPFEKTIFIK